MVCRSVAALSALAAIVAQFQLLAAFSVTSSNRISKTALGVSFPNHAMDEGPEDGHPNRHVEFTDLEPIPESSARKERVQQDKKNQGKFVKYGDDLWDLRKTMTSLSKKLVAAINSGSRDKEEAIRSRLREAESQDPELVYKLELEQMEKAKRDGRMSDAEQHSRNAVAARSCLPQFNLDGLWVGK